MKVNAKKTDPEFRPVTLTVELETPVELEAFMKLCGNPNLVITGLSERGVFAAYTTGGGVALRNALASILSASSLALKSANKEDF